MRLKSRSIDRQRAARIVLAFALDDGASLDQVLRECDEAADNHGVTGVLLALVDTLYRVSLANAGTERALLDGAAARADRADEARRHAACHVALSF